MNASTVLATNDPEVVKLVSKIVIDKDWCLLVTESKVQSIFNVLDHELTFFMLDFDLPSNSNFELLSIIRRIRPRLPTIVFSGDNSLSTIKKFAEMGVFYCALKPLVEEEVRQILEAVENYSREQQNINLATF